LHFSEKMICEVTRKTEMKDATDFPVDVLLEEFFRQ